MEQKEKQHVHKKRRTETEEKALNLITHDLITDIISRVPAKDLTRFTCVSQSWCTLICTDPYFTRLQIQRTASLDRPFLLIEKEVKIEKKVNAARYHYLYYNYLMDLDSSINVGEIHTPFDNARVLGSCRGLLVLQNQPGLQMAVSNPTTRKHRMVPPNPAGDANNVSFCGLGYDRAHDCYKLVTKVTHKRDYNRDHSDCALEFMIYDLNKDTWYKYQITKDKHPYPRLEYYERECVDGVVYWFLDKYRWVRTEICNTMICFVLAEEEFHELETPDFGEIKYYPTMTVLDGRLSIGCSEINQERHEVWCSYSWSWTKMLSISDPRAMVPGYEPGKYVDLVPVCVSACKTKILYVVRNRDLFWYDIGHKEFHKVNHGPVNYRDVRGFVPSLLGLGIF